jgi:hypothetical protein
MMKNLEWRSFDDYRSTPLHITAKCSSSVEVVRAFISSLSLAALLAINGEGETPLVTTIFYEETMLHWKLQVLLEAAPQAARIDSLLKCG